MNYVAHMNCKHMYLGKGCNGTLYTIKVVKLNIHGIKKSIVP